MLNVTAIPTEIERARDHALPGREHLTEVTAWRAAVQLLRGIGRRSVRARRRSRLGNRALIVRR
jgi:hypothetical protein